MILELILGCILGGLIGAAIALAVISISAVIECARELWGSRTNVVVGDPSISSELESVAAQKGTKRHKRFVYHKSTGRSELVESDLISASWLTAARSSCTSPERSVQAVGRT